MLRSVAAILVLAVSSWAGAALAQAVVPYGMPIGLDGAKKAADAALAEAKSITQTPYVVAIVDPDGVLVYFEREDDAQIGSVRVAIDKARSAALFRRPTKVFEDALDKGRTAIMALHGAVALEGGLPLVADGKIVGAIGASGGTGAQDSKVAKAGADTLK